MEHRPKLSQTVMVAEKVPVLVGVPVKVPSGLRVTPGGRAPAVTTKLYVSPSGSLAVRGRRLPPISTVCDVLAGSLV